MFNVYADFGNGFIPIYNPVDNDLTIHNPKVTLEVGKSGSFQFEIPPTNLYYSSLQQLKTKVKVDYSDETSEYELFRGRVFTVSINFNKMKTVYCEGLLAYLVDTVQKAKSFGLKEEDTNGNAKRFFRSIIANHNEMMKDEPDKQFTVGDIDFLEGETVIIPGKKDDDDKYYGTSKYEQAIIETIADEWLTTFDYINNVLTDYLGGYLVAWYDQDRKKNIIDYVSDSAIYGDGMIITSMGKKIEFGENLIDLGEELNAEELCTVVIPLGDAVKEKVTTIEKASKEIKNAYKDEEHPRNNYYVYSVKGKEIGIANEWAVKKYGIIIKTHSFENVNNPDTLMKDGVKWLKKNKNIPVKYTVKAVDMRFIDPLTAGTIELGDVVNVVSPPHDIDIQLVCTKIEYDLANPGNNSYTLGTQDNNSLTERYRKDKNKDKKNGSRNGSSGGGAAAAAAAYDAELFAGDAVDWYNSNGDNAILAYEWVASHGRSMLEVFDWYNDHAAGAITTYEWLSEYSAGMEKSLWWYNQWAAGVIKDYQWLSTYSAGMEKSLEWYNQWAAGAIRSYEWLETYGAGMEKSLEWYNENAGGVIRSREWLDENSAGMEKSLEWYNRWAAGAIRNYEWLETYSAGMEKSLRWYNENAGGVIRSREWLDEHSAGIEKSVEWYGQYSSGLIWDHAWITDNYAGAQKAIAWNGTYANAVASDYWWLSGKKAHMTRALNWYDENSYSLASITQLTDSQRAAITSIAKWTGKNDDGTGFYNAFTSVQQSASSSGAIIKFLVSGSTKDKHGNIASLTLNSNVDGSNIKLSATKIQAECKQFLLSGNLKGESSSAIFGGLQAKTITSEGTLTGQALSITGTDGSVMNGGLTVNGGLIVSGGLKIRLKSKDYGITDYVKEKIITSDYIKGIIDSGYILGIIANAKSVSVKNLYATENAYVFKSKDNYPVLTTKWKVDKYDKHTHEYGGKANTYKLYLSHSHKDSLGGTTENGLVNAKMITVEYSGTTKKP